MEINEVIVGPLITEKTTNLVKNNVYTFLVNKKASKPQIKTVLESLYKVKVAEVRLVNRKGKNKKVGRFLREKKLPDTKVAYVKLKKGSLEIFPKA
jgi:large subunit ribosomal protein L23